jgi:hypothetical protein
LKDIGSTLDLEREPGKRTDPTPSHRGTRLQELGMQ